MSETPIVGRRLIDIFMLPAVSFAKHPEGGAAGDGGLSK